MHVLFEKGDETCMKTTVSSLNYLKIAMDVMGLSDTNFTEAELDESYKQRSSNNKTLMIKDAYYFLKKHLPTSKEIDHPESNQKTITTVYDKFDINTLCDIHKTIFGGLYEWAGEFRTIQMTKSEKVLFNSKVYV